MSIHTLSYKVEGIQDAQSDGLAKLLLSGSLPYSRGTSHSVLFVDEAVAVDVRLRDALTVTIEVPEDDDPVDPEPEDAPTPALRTAYDAETERLARKFGAAS